MITLYRAFLVILAVIAGAMIPEAMGLPKDAQYTIGPGFLPLIMLGLTIASCIALLVLDLRKKSEVSVKLDAIPKMLKYIIGTALLILGMEHLGIVVSLILYIFGITYFVEKHPLFESAKVAIITSVLIYLIFHTWLAVPMSICNFF